MINLNFTIIAILSAVFAAIASILARTLLKDIKSKDILGINFLTMGAVLLLISPMFYFFEPSILSILLLLSVGLIDGIANYFYFKIFEKTEASVAAPLISLAPVFAFFFSWVLIGESVDFLTLFLSITIVALIVLFSLNTKKIKEFKTDTLIPGLTASVLFGLSAIPSKMLLSNLEVINAPTLYMFRSGLIALLALLFFRFPIRRITIKQYRIIFVRGLFVIGQWVFLYLALSKGSTGVSVTLGNITPIFVFILGFFFLKEKITLKKVLAAGLVLILSFVV